MIGLDQEETENINCKLQNLQKRVGADTRAFTKAQTREQTIRTLELAEADYIKVQEQGEKNSTGVGRTKRKKAGK